MCVCVYATLYCYYKKKKLLSSIPKALLRSSVLAINFPTMITNLLKLFFST